MTDLVYTCACLNVELRCSESAVKKSCPNQELQEALGTDKLVYLDKPQKHVKHDWLIRERTHQVKHCAACNTRIFHTEADGIVVVPENLRRSEADLEKLRRHDCFSDCFQIVVDPSSTVLQSAIDIESLRKDSLVPGYLESVRLKMIQVVKQMICEKQRIIEEEHRKAMDQLRALQSKCDFQCNTLLKIVEYQDNAEMRRSTTTSKNSVQRSESTDSKTSVQSSKEPNSDDDVFEMQFNDEAIYEDDSHVEPAEEAKEVSGSDDDDEDEGVSTASQERTQKSDMDLSQYASSLPIEVPRDAQNWHGGSKPSEFSRNRLDHSPAKPECIDDIARSMKDLSDRMMDDQTKMFGEIPRPRLYTNHF